MIITIARQCGCGAVKVGRLLAQHYGIPFYTRKNLMEMANQRGVLDEMESFFDERPMDELLFAMSSFGDSPRSLTERPERDDLVSVFLKGNLEDRIRDIQDEQQISTFEAKEFVEHADDCRVAYHKYYTGLTWGNADDYDLCLDTVRLGEEKTAHMIEEYVESVLAK